MSTIKRRRTACRTCVRRKVKCDEMHPKCERCQKGEFICEGYDPEFVFVEEDPTKQYKSASCNRSDSKGPDRASTSRETSSGAESSITPTASRNASNIRQSGLAIDDALTYPAGTASTRLNANEIPYLSLTTAAYLGTEGFASSNRDPNDTAVSFFARVSQDVEERKPNSRRFGQTLRLLNDKLQEQANGRSGDIWLDIAATLVKDLILLGTDSSEWIKHVDGLARLIVFHKPKAFTSPSKRDFLSSIRGIIARKCMLEKKPCFLSEPDWQKIPWSSDDREKGIFEQLEDIYVQIPGVVARVAALNRSGKETPENAINLGREIRQQLIGLFQWRCI